MVFKTILVCEKEMLLVYEQRAIDVLKPEYNICQIAYSTRGLKRSPESRAKSSASMMGKNKGPKSEAARLASIEGIKRRIALVGPPSVAALLRHNEAMRGKPLPAELRAKLSESRKIAWSKTVLTDEARAAISAATKAGIAKAGPRKAPRRTGICHAGKLTWDDVMIIRSSSERGCELAARFNVTPQHISGIQSGRKWPGLPPGFTGGSAASPAKAAVPAQKF